MATAHKPWPWSVTENSWCRTTVYDANGFEVASLRVDEELDGGPAIEAEKRMAAHARLIAAAPELLVSASDALMLIGDLTDSVRFTDRVQALEASLRAAIAKATGGEPA